MHRIPAAPSGDGERRTRTHGGTPGRRRRVALYSHDTQGLGHIRRNVALAAALVRAEPETDVLLLSGAPEAPVLPLPRHTDVVTLPTLSKSTSGQYAARRLSLPLREIVALRSDLCRSALVAFAPDLLVVDKVARGVGGELEPALRALRAARGTRTVLGLREVLDEPVAAAREWHADGTSEAVHDFYDAVWVYGDPAVYDPVREYALPVDVVAKTSFTGYLSRWREEGVVRSGLPREHAVLPGRPYVLCTVGGGQDGHALAQAFVSAPMPEGHDGVLLTGPYMRRADKESLARVAEPRPDLHVVEFAAEMHAYLSRASAVVSMAGYNTTCELLAERKRALLVPRTTPRAEQLVRARSLERLGLVDVLDPLHADPAALGRWLAAAVVAGPVAGPRVDLDGLRAVPHLAGALLATAPHTRPVPRPRPASEDSLVAR